LPVALITGASRGIGAAAARCFAAAGFDLLLVARSAERLAALAEELRTPSCQVLTAAIDLADPSAIEAGILELCSRGLTPTVVINNAGAAWTGPLATMPLDSWQWLLQLNLTSVFQVCKAVLPLLRCPSSDPDRAGGLIINVSSHAARNAFPDWGAYCASKAALQAFSRCLAEEERAHGVRVCTAKPSSVPSIAVPCCQPIRRLELCWSWRSSPPPRWWKISPSCRRPAPSELPP
jgi:short-subunit dehydrogenase